MAEKLRILIDDGDPFTCEFLTIVLAEEGYTTIVRNRLSAKLDQLKDLKPNLVLLDIPAYEANKRSIMQSYRDHLDRDIPIVVLTTALHPAQVAEETHANGYVAKPFDLDELLRVIIEHLPRGTRPGQYH